MHSAWGRYDRRPSRSYSSRRGKARWEDAKMREQKPVSFFVGTYMKVLRCDQSQHQSEQARNLPIGSRETGTMRPGKTTKSSQ